MKTYIEQLNSKSIDSRNSIKEFLDTCSVYYSDPNSQGGGLFFVNPTLYHWGNPVSDEFGRKQVVSLKIAKDFFEYYNLLLKHFTEGKVKSVQKKQKYILGLIQRSVKAPSSIEKAKSYVDDTISNFIKILDRLKNSQPQIVIIPDTNSLLKSPDPANYNYIAKQPSFEFLFTPTVTKELDKLKITHRDNDFRKKVNSVIKRIKGFRTQGSLIYGVTYQKSIMIRAIANEPKFDNLLEWLDKENDDDRLIATVLQEIIENPGNHTILVTSDINLQNKAEFAMINYCETPISK